MVGGPRYWYDGGLDTDRQARGLFGHLGNQDGAVFVGCCEGLVFADLSEDCRGLEAFFGECFTDEVPCHPTHQKDQGGDAGDNYNHLNCSIRHIVVLQIDVCASTGGHLLAEASKAS